MPRANVIVNNIYNDSPHKMKYYELKMKYKIQLQFLRKKFVVIVEIIEFKF